QTLFQAGEETRPAGLRRCRRFRGRRGLRGGGFRNHGLGRRLGFGAERRLERRGGGFFFGRLDGLGSRGRCFRFLSSVLEVLAPPAEQALLLASVGLGLLVVVGTKHVPDFSKVRHAQAWPPGNGIGYPSTSSPDGVKPHGPQHRSPFKVPS